MSEDPLLIVIYASAARSKLKGDELAQILATARSFNTENNISGMLVYHAGSFLQVLEGPPDVVEALVKKIKNDPRHHDFKLLLEEQTEDREFDEWSMGFADTTGMAAEIEGFVDYQRDFQKALSDKSVARRILQGFKEGTWRRYVGS